MTAQNKRINLSFNEDEFNLIQGIAVSTNRKVANLIKTWTLEKISRTQNFKQDEEEREILADVQLTKRLKDAAKRAQSGQTVKKSKYIN